MVTPPTCLKFHPIPSSGLPCRRDRPLTSSFSLIGVCVHKLWLKMRSVRKDEEKKLFQNFARSYLGTG